MVAGPRLLELLEERVELGLLEEGGAVHAREHLALGVAAPIGAGHGLQLERPDALGAGRVRAAAQVGERAVGVQRDGLEGMGGVGIADQVLDELDLVVLALLAEALERLRDRHVLARERLVGGDVLAHLRLDRLEVGVGEADAVGEVEVVVEAVLDRRPDRDLHPRVELHDRGGEHVRGVVADEIEGVLAAAIGDDLERLVGLERQREVAQLPVLLDGQRGARQSRPDGRGGIGAARPFGELERRAIGKRDLHRSRCYASAVATVLPAVIRGRSERAFVPACYLGRPRGIAGSLRPHRAVASRRPHAGAFPATRSPRCVSRSLEPERALPVRIRAFAHGARWT